MLRPPECLAIQFATTQYFSWKSSDDIAKAAKAGEGERAKDIRFWDKEYVHKAANIISTYYHENLARIQGLPTTTDGPGEPSPASYPPQTPSPVPTIDLNKEVPNMDEVDVPLHSQHSQKQQHIVISAHPKQRELVDKIRKELTKLDFEVWSSTDMTIGTIGREDDCIPMTPQFEKEFPGFGDAGQGEEQTVFLSSQRTGHSESSQESIHQDPMSQYSQRSFIYPSTSAHRPTRLNFSLSQDFRHLVPHCSQYTFNENYSQQSILTPEDSNKARTFKNRVKRSRVVIMLLSRDYCQSRICKQQAFYCNFRTKVIAVKVDDYRLPVWAEKCVEDNHLIDLVSDRSVKDDDAFLMDVRIRVQRLHDKLNSNSLEIFKSDMVDAKIHSYVTYITKELKMNTDRKRLFVYITGSTKFRNSHSADICRAIGHQLAQCELITLVTDGFYGVSEISARSFCEERDLMKERPVTQYNILPKRDHKVYNYEIVYNESYLTLFSL